MIAILLRYSVNAPENIHEYSFLKLLIANTDNTTVTFYEYVYYELTLNN